MTTTDTTILSRNSGILHRFDPGKNFMTPRILSTNYYPLSEDGPIAGYIVEKSKGTGFRREPIWGVSIIAVDIEGKRCFRGETGSEMHHVKQYADNHYRRTCRAFSRGQFPAIAAKE